MNKIVENQIINSKKASQMGEVPSWDLYKN